MPAKPWVEGYLIACTDNLKGFGQNIESSFTPKRSLQGRYKELFEMGRENLHNNWQGKYPTVIQSWKNDFDKLTVCSQYTDTIRKVTKPKGVFTPNIAVQKLVYLSTGNTEKK